MTPFDSHAPEPFRGRTSGADISTAETRLGATIEKMEEQMLRIDEQETRMRRFEERLESREKRGTETLAVYIALFTFLSVNVNIFTRITDPYAAIWFMLLMAISSIIIASSLFFFLHNRGKWYQLLLVLAFLIALTVLLVVPHLGAADLRLNPATQVPPAGY
jgi:heme/copper-type cytochrome/quinol oxidase subunit 4